MTGFDAVQSQLVELITAECKPGGCLHTAPAGGGKARVSAANMTKVYQFNQKTPPRELMPDSNAFSSRGLGALLAIEGLVQGRVSADGTVSVVA